MATEAFIHGGAEAGTTSRELVPSPLPWTPLTKRQCLLMAIKLRRLRGLVAGRPEMDRAIDAQEQTI